MIVDKWGAVNVVSNGRIQIADYSIFCQPTVHGQSCIVTGKYSTYFTVSVRNASGVAENIDFSFQMVGNNY